VPAISSSSGATALVRLPTPADSSRSSPAQNPRFGAVRATMPIGDGQHTDRLGAPARGQVPPRSVVAAGRGRPPGARQAAHDQVSAPNRRVALFDHCGSWRCCRPARGGGVAVDQQGRAGADLGTPGPGGRGQRAGCRCLARPRGDGPGRLRLPVAGPAGGQPAQAGPGVKLPWARVAGWPAAPPRRLGAPHRERSGAVAPGACMAARPEPGSGRVLRATCR